MNFKERYATDGVFREAQKQRQRDNTKAGREARGKPPAPPRARSRGKPFGVVATLLSGAKHRARRDGLDFSITHADIVVPELCPVMGTTLRVGVGRVCLQIPSLDRIDPTQGYVPGNVRVISSEANRLKDRNTIETLTKLLAYVRGEV